MSFSNYLEDKVLGHVFAGVAYSAPATMYIALFTAAPSDSGGGTEVSGGSYARKAVTPSQFTKSGTNPTQVANNVDLDHVTATANWGLVTHAALFDASSGGNMLQWGALTTSKQIDSGDTMRWPSGSYVVTLD